MLEDVFVRFEEVEDGDVIGYVFREDPHEGGEPIACILIVPPYLAIASAKAFMEILADILQLDDFHSHRDSRTFYIP